MDIDIKELIKAAAEGLDLKDFKGDVVGVKVVENEIGNVEAGGIGIQIVNGKEEATNEPCPLHRDDEQQQDIIDKLKPIFYGDEGKAKDFLISIKGMKSTQITAKVNQLVSENVISELSRKRDLWTVLHENGLYVRTETNWNDQVK